MYTASFNVQELCILPNKMHQKLFSANPFTWWPLKEILCIFFTTVNETCVCVCVCPWETTLSRQRHSTCSSNNNFFQDITQITPLPIRSYCCVWESKKDRSTLQYCNTTPNYVANYLAKLSYSKPRATLRALLTSKVFAINQKPSLRYGAAILFLHCQGLWKLR
jgi:hypothetical protein